MNFFNGLVAARLIDLENQSILKERMKKKKLR